MSPGAYRCKCSINTNNKARMAGEVQTMKAHFSCSRAWFSPQVILKGPIVEAEWEGGTSEGLTGNGRGLFMKAEGARKLASLSLDQESPRNLVSSSEDRGGGQKLTNLFARARDMDWQIASFGGCGGWSRAMVPLAHRKMQKEGPACLNGSSYFDDPCGRSKNKESYTMSDGE